MFLFLHVVKTASLIAYFPRFSNEFRKTTDGQAIINETSPEKRYTVRAVIAAADRWRSMSPEEQAVSCHFRIIKYTILIKCVALLREIQESKGRVESRAR
jgi:hypothetical protein